MYGFEEKFIIVKLSLCLGNNTLHLYTGSSEILEATAPMTGCNITREVEVKYHSAFLKYHEIIKNRTTKMIVMYQTLDVVAEDIELVNGDTLQTTIVHNDAKSAFQKRIMFPAAHYMVIKCAWYIYVHVHIYFFKTTPVKTL